MRAIAATAIVPPLLELVSFARMERTLRAMAGIHTMKAPTDRDAGQWVDRNLARLPQPWKHTCLRRSAILYYLLRSAGQHVDLCIGVRRDGSGELLAHAWLRRDGEIYLEPGNITEVAASYTVIAQFPEPA